MSETPPDEREREPPDAAGSPPPPPDTGAPEPPIAGASQPPVDPPPALAAPMPMTTGVPHFAPPMSPALGLPVPPSGIDAGVAALPAPEERSRIRSAGRFLRELAETVVLALLIFLLVRAVVQNFQVEGSSMQPTLQTQWYLLVNKALYWEVNLETVSKFVPFVDPGDDPTRYIFRGPQRGDIIVFKDPNGLRGEGERDFIKRIIGLPGETVEVRNGTVFIDGKPLDEPYINEKPNYTCGPLTVPPGEYYVLGDNRNNSSDSHSWGFLPKGNIIGRAWLTYWPFSQFGLVDGTSAEPDASQQQPVSKENPARDPENNYCPAVP